MSSIPSVANIVCFAIVKQITKKKINNMNLERENRIEGIKVRIGEEGGREGEQ